MLAKINYIQNAHRLSLYDIDATVGDIHAGQLFQLNNEGKWVYADGTKKAYPTMNDRYAGKGLGLQSERLEGRDNVSRVGKIACLKGNYEIGTDQYDKDATYTYGAPLVPSTDPTKRGQVTVAAGGATPSNPLLVVGFVTQVPANDNELLHYEG